MHGPEAVRRALCRPPCVIDDGQSVANAGKTCIINHGYLIQQKNLECKKVHDSRGLLREVDVGLEFVVELEQVVDSRCPDARPLNFDVRRSNSRRRRRPATLAVHQTLKENGVQKETPVGVKKIKTNFGSKARLTSPRNGG